MSSDTTLTDADGNEYSLDNFATQKWLDGQSEGAKIVCGYLKEKATALFQDRRHEEAIRLQGLAVDIETKIIPEMEKRASVHKKIHPYELKRTR